MPSSGVWLVLQLPAHAGSSLADFSTLKMEAIRSSETSVQSTTSTRHHTPEDGILNSHRRENLKSCNIIIIPAVWYGSETWSLTLREEHRLRVFENNVIGWLFAPKRDETIGGWRKLHSEVLHKLCSSPNIIRMINTSRLRWTRNVARMEGKWLHTGFLMGMPERNRSLAERVVAFKDSAWWS
jgi:hypothetical protein